MSVMRRVISRFSWPAAAAEGTGDAVGDSMENLRWEEAWHECRRKDRPALEGVVGDSVSAVESESEEARPWLMVGVVSSKNESFPSRRKVCMSRLNLRAWLSMRGSW